MLTFLVIDDSQITLQLLQLVLKFGFKDAQILTASDGKAGLKLAFTHKPDLIICNWFMPYMRGHEVLKHLYEDEEMRSIPFLLESSMGREHVNWLQDEFGLDADKHFMQCPLLPREFLKRVQYLLDERESKRIMQRAEKLLKLYPIEEGGQRLFTSK